MENQNFDIDWFQKMDMLDAYDRLGDRSLQTPRSRMKVYALIVLIILLGMLTWSLWQEYQLALLAQNPRWQWIIMNHLNK